MVVSEVGLAGWLWGEPETRSFSFRHPPGSLLSEKQRAEDLAQGPGAEQVLGAALTHSGEMPQQAVERQPVLGGQRRRAGDVTQQLGTFFGICCLCGETEGVGGGGRERERACDEKRCLQLKKTNTKKKRRAAELRRQRFSWR